MDWQVFMWNSKESQTQFPKVPTADQLIRTGKHKTCCGRSLNRLAKNLIESIRLIAMKRKKGCRVKENPPLDEVLFYP